METKNKKIIKINGSKKKKKKQKKIKKNQSTKFEIGTEGEKR